MIVSFSRSASRARAIHGMQTNFPANPTTPCLHDSPNATARSLGISGRFLSSVVGDHHGEIGNVSGLLDDVALLPVDDVGQFRGLLPEAAHQLPSGHVVPAALVVVGAESLFHVLSEGR